MPDKTEFENYYSYLAAKEREWEELCIRCGGCCGAYDDPCQYLKRDQSSKFYCAIYPERLGTRKTIGGEEFDCVRVKKILHIYWKNDYLCNYKRYWRMPWKLNSKRCN